MIFQDGFLKKYSTLRDQKPSMYYLEEFSYKVLQLTVKPDYSIWYKDIDLRNEKVVTVNFPEFLDVSSNLDLIKSVHFDYDISINQVNKLTDTGSSDKLKLVHNTDFINSFLKEPKSVFSSRLFPSLPPDLCKLYFGYRHTAVLDPNVKLENNKTLCCEQLVEMEDSCFTWLDITNNMEAITKTNKSSVCKFKVEISIPVLFNWLNTAFPNKSIEQFLAGMQLPEIDINIILHPPYLSRMSFKNSIKIVYPLQTTRLKVVDKVSFRTNKSYITNNKLYQIIFIDKDSQQRLYVFDTIKNYDLFDHIKTNKDTSNINSYFDDERVSFEDSVLVTFKVPVPVQMFLSKHKNYKIRIISKDLTTQERG